LGQDVSFIADLDRLSQFSRHPVRYLDERQRQTRGYRLKLSEWAYLRASSRSHCIQKIADFQDFLEPLRFRLSRWSATNASTVRVSPEV
jgi:hypothetical protein